MEQSKKKTIMIAIVVVCLTLAIAITVLRSKSDQTGLEGIDPGSKIWVKCANPDCGAEMQMSEKQFYEEARGKIAPVCPKCGEESLFQAVKCPKCGIVFIRGTVRNDFKDRCPECSYSQMEEDRKK